MIKSIFDVPLYDWNITYLTIESKEDVPELLTWCQLFDAEFEHDLNDTFDTIKNAGLTYMDKTAQKMLIVIFPCESSEELLSTIGHEKRHAEDIILEESGVYDKEAAGYLAGFLTKQMFTLC